MLFLEKLRSVSFSYAHACTHCLMEPSAHNKSGILRSTLHMPRSFQVYRSSALQLAAHRFHMSYHPYPSLATSWKTWTWTVFRLTACCLYPCWRDLIKRALVLSDIIQFTVSPQGNENHSRLPYYLLWILFRGVWLLVFRYRLWRCSCSRLCQLIFRSFVEKTQLLFITSMLSVVMFNRYSAAYPYVSDKVSANVVCWKWYMSTVCRTLLNQEFEFMFHLCLLLIDVG